MRNRVESPVVENHSNAWHDRDTIGRFSVSCAALAQEERKHWELEKVRVHGSLLD